MCRKDLISLFRGNLTQYTRSLKRLCAFPRYQSLIIPFSTCQRHDELCRAEKSQLSFRGHKKWEINMGNLKLWNWSFEDELFIARNIVSSDHYRYPIPRFSNFLKRNVFLVLAQKLSVGANIRPLKLLHFVHSSCGSVLVSWDGKLPGKSDEAACFASSKLQS